MLRALPGLGDFLCATPALRTLRCSLSQAHITLIGLPQASLSSRYGFWNDFLPFPGAPGLPEVPFDAERLAVFLNAYRGRFDAVLQLHGSGPQSNTFVRALAAPLTAGFYQKGQEGPPGPHFLPWCEDEHEVRRGLRLLSYLGISVGITEGEGQDTALSFPLLTDDLARADALKCRYGLRDYLILHPGAASEAKRWPPLHFAAIGRAAQTLGLHVAITGSAGERELTQRLAQRLPGALNLCGETDLGTLAALLKGARLLVCNDTGVSHLAAATQTPSVVVFLKSNPARWAPLDTSRHIAIQAGLEHPSTKTVLAAMHTLLGGTHEHSDLARPRGVPLLPNT